VVEFGGDVADFAEVAESAAARNRDRDRFGPFVDDA
jgi:hypothetical protein